MPWYLIGLALLSSTLVLPPVKAQEDKASSEAPSYRSLTIGRALLPDGEGWSSAEVFFLHRPLPEHREVGQEDLIRIQTSAKGRFRAKLLDRRPYMVWARSRDAQGRIWISKRHGLVMAGSPIKILRREKPSMPEVLNLRGWEKAAKPAVAFQLRFGPMHQVLEVPAGSREGSLILPPTPYEVSCLEALDSQGAVVRERFVERRALPIFPLSWAYTSPESIKLEIRNGEDPVAGADVSIRMIYDKTTAERGETTLRGFNGLVSRTPYSRWASLGRSDAKGMCQIQLPRTAIQEDSVYLRISAQGLMEKFVRIWPYSRRERSSAKARDRVVPVAMTKGTKVQGRIFWTQGKPAADLPLLILRKANYQLDEQTLTLLPAGQLQRTGRDGSFSFSFLGPKDAYRIVTAMDEEVWKRLSASFPGLPLPDPELLLLEAPMGRELAGELGDLCLDELIAVDARVPANREPGSEAPILLLKHRQDTNTSSSRAAYVLSRRFGPRGRTVFLMPSGKFNCLLLHAERGSSQESLAPAKGPPGTVFRWDVGLTPFVSIPVQVRTKDGKLLGGIRLETMGGGYTHMDSLCSEIYKFNTMSIERTVTDKQGKTNLFLMKVTNQNYDVVVDWQKAKKLGLSVTPVRLDSNSYPESIEIEVEK